VLQGYWAQFLDVTEEAAIAAMPLCGRGDKNAADQAAVDGMHRAFKMATLSARVAIGEGEMDEAPMLYIGEELGAGGPSCDIAVDPLEGTSLTAEGRPGAMTVLAAGPRDALLHAPDMYMEKFCAGPAAKGALDPEAPLAENLRRLAKALGKKPGELRAAILDRPRHQEILADLRALGAAVTLLAAGDVGPAVATCLPDGDVDLVVGTGGAPEGVITAAAVRCLGGEFWCRLRPENDEERRRAREMLGDGAEKLLKLSDVVRSDDLVFAATSVTDSVAGPAPEPGLGGRYVHSLVVAGGTIRRLRRFVPGN
jgi:fructose-1,6-bisphosphatase II